MKKNKSKKYTIQKQDVLFLLFIVLISVLLKFAILFTNSNLWNGEECWVGTIANEMINRPDLSFKWYYKCFYFLSRIPNSTALKL